MRTINVETINFTDVEASGKTENYPNSGFFIIKVEKDKRSDFGVVDKKVKHVFFVCPESHLDEVFDSKEIVEPFKNAKQYNEQISEFIKYDGDFILEFARILLNRK